ncbi:hypothetical protein Tco_1001843 [Tanacetum coccineum]
MLVQDQGEGPTIPVVSHHTPTSGPSTSQPPSTPPSIQTTPVAEEAAPMPHDSPLLRVHSLGSDEGSLSLNELTVLCTSLVKKLEQTIKTSQARRRAKVVIFDAEEDEEYPSKQGMSLIEKLDIDAGISLVSPHVANQGRFDDTQLNKEGMLKIFTLTLKEEEQLVLPVVELVLPVNCIDEELAQNVHEEEQARFNAEQEAKFKAKQEQERLDHENTMKIQEELDAAERQKMDQFNIRAGEKVSDEDLPRKLVELVNQRKKFFAQQRAEAKRNKPMTFAQQKEYTKVQSFMPMDSELEVQRLKRAGQDVVEEPAKRQRTGEASGSVQEQTDEEPKAEELSQEQLHQIMMVIPIEEVYVEALQVKYPIIDWEIYFEDSRKYWKIIRVGGHTEAYQTFDDMLKKFDRDDLDKLWILVKERFRIQPTEDKAREL